MGTRLFERNFVLLPLCQSLVDFKGATSHWLPVNKDIDPIGADLPIESDERATSPAYYQLPLTATKCVGGPLAIRS